MPPARTTYPPLITASQWATVFDATWKKTLDARKRSPSDPLIRPATLINATVWESARKRSGSAFPALAAPRLRNSEVITLVMAWLPPAGASRFPLWYQFAASAYGWTPKSDKLDVRARRGAAWFPDSLAADLWLSLADLAERLDAERVSSPRTDMDGAFSDVVFQGEVRAALRGDGAAAVISAKLPTGACRDVKSGKVSSPVLECVAPDGARSAPRYRNGVPYCVAPSKLRARCADGSEPVELDDPITGIARGVMSPVVRVLLFLGVAWMLLDDSNPRRRRR